MSGSLLKGIVAMGVALGCELASAQSCTPYAPTTGLFYNDVGLVNVPTTPPGTAGSYAISRTSSEVTVTQGGRTVARATFTAGAVVTYAFFPTSGASPNRFLLLDVHWPTSSIGNEYVDAPVLFDLNAWSGSVLAGKSLRTVTIASSDQLHWQYSGEDGLALFVWYGTSRSGQRAMTPVIYRSDTGAAICAPSSFDPQVEPYARATATTVEIMDGGTVRYDGTCALPRGVLEVTPTTWSAPAIASNQTATKSFTFRNVGNDCLSVSALSSSSTAFHPIGFSAFALGAGASRTQDIAFDPAGGEGSYSGTIQISRTPAQGTASLSVSGTSYPPVIISSGRATPGLGRVTLSWTTNLPSTTEATCGGASYSDQSLVTAHTAVVTGLSAATSYECMMTSRDVHGLTASAATSSSTADGNGAFSSILKVPYCPVSSHPTAACDSGALLTGKGASEPNAPNILDDYSCTPEGADGDSGTGLSVSRITVEAVDGLELAEGKRVKATVWVVPAVGTDFIDPCPYCDQLDLYYQPNHVSGWGSSWQYLTTLQYPTATTYLATTAQPLTFEFTMGTGAQHVLLANLRNTSEYMYGWDTRYPDVCTFGHGDRDTLVFYVNTEPVAPCTKSFATDPRNCGACGHVCPAGGPNTGATCGGGTCGISCQSGYYDCNGVASDGCESTDPTCGKPPACGQEFDSCNSDAECCEGLYCELGHIHQCER